MLQIRFLLAVLFLTVGLYACGGGGGGGSSGDVGGAGGVQLSATAEAQYASATDISEMYILDDGSFYLLNLGVSLNGSYYVHGTGVSTQSTFTGTGTQFIFAGDLYRNIVDVSAEYTPESSLAMKLGSVNAPLQKKFVGTFVPDFLTPVKQSDVTGAYVNGASLPAMTIDPSGNLLMDNFMVAPCLITGSIHPHGNNRLYDVELNFASSSLCSAQRKKGVAILKGTSLLFVMDDGYYLSLTKM